MQVLEYMAREGHEQIMMCVEPSVGLKAFIAIHDTTLGPACGGCRIWPHATEAAALEDVLRLSKAMTYKSAAAELPLGGGKGLIIADPRKDKTEGLMRAFGRFVASLGGRYVTTEDVGCTLRDMEYVSLETKHVVGLPRSMGGSGETSIMTGLGVYMGMKAAAKAKWGSDSLSGRTVAIQGFGNVAANLAPHLIKEGAQMVAADLFPEAQERARKLGARVVDAEAIYDVACDVFSPCALGATVNATTIPRLKCGVVAGGANNQLATPEDAERLAKRGIAYAPDYIINAGGVINVSCEVGMNYNEDLARHRTQRIYETMERVLALASREEITTAEAADRIARERVEAVRGIRELRRFG